MNKNKMKELNELFESHKKVLLSISNLLQEEKNALMKDDITAFTDVIEKKVEYVDELERMESVRQDKYGDITLSYFEKLEAEYDENVDMTLVKSLKEKILELHEISQNLWREQETNTLLIQQSIGYSNMLMQTIQSIIKKTGTYGKNAKIDATPLKAGLDKSV